MNSIGQIEHLILRFPEIARETGSVAAFWAYLETALEVIWDSAESEGTMAEIEKRFDDLVQMASAEGLVRSDVD